MIFPIYGIVNVIVLMHVLAVYFGSGLCILLASVSARHTLSFSCLVLILV